MQSQLFWTSLSPPFLLTLSPPLFSSPAPTDMVAPNPSWQAKLRWHPLSLTPVGKLIKMSASISSLPAWSSSFISACWSSAVCFYLVNETRQKMTLGGTTFNRSGRLNHEQNHRDNASACPTLTRMCSGPTAIRWEKNIEQATGKDRRTQWNKIYFPRIHHQKSMKLKAVICIQKKKLLLLPKINFICSKFT